MTSARVSHRRSPAIPSEPKPMWAGRARRTASWLLLLVSAVVIARYFYRHSEDFSLLRSLNMVHLVSLLSAQFAYYFLHSGRFQALLCKSSGQSIAYRECLRLFVLGRFLNTLFPQLGNVFRAQYLKTKHQVAYTEYLSTFFSLAWIGTLFNTAVAALAISITRPELRLAGWHAGAVLAVVSLVQAVAPYLLLKLLRKRPLAGNRLGWLRNRMTRLLEIAVNGLQDPVYALKILGFSFGALVLGCITFTVGFSALGRPVLLGEVLLYFTVLQLSNYVVLTPGNLGVRELVFAWLGLQLGVGVGESMLVSALARAANYCALVALSLSMGGVAVLKQTTPASRAAAP